MSDDQTKLLEGWGSLSETGRRDVLSYLNFRIELKDPEFHEKALAREREFQKNKETVKELSSQLEKARAQTRDIITTRLPDETIRSLVVMLEMLTLLGTLADYKPIYFYDAKSKTSMLAKNLIKSLPEILAKVEGVPA